MANYGGMDPGRAGPYWRRQQGNTLPGERTAAQLAAVNAARAQMGLPPLGGPTQRVAVSAGVGEGRHPLPPYGAGPFPYYPGLPTGDQPRGGGVGPMAGEPGAAPPGMQQGGGLGQLQLPQLLALKAMFAKATGQQGRPAMPAMPVQRGVLPQLHQAVPVRAHIRIVPPRPALGPQNLPSHLRGAYPA